MRIPLRIAGHSLLLALRDPKGMIFALLMPLIFAAIMGSISPGAPGRRIEPATALIVNADVPVAVPQSPAIGTAVAQYGTALTDALLGSEGLRQVLTGSVATDAAAARHRVETGRATALIYIPPTFTADMLAGRRTVITVTTDPGDPTRGTAVAQAVHSLADVFASRLLAAGRLATGAVGPDGAGPLISEIPAGIRPVSTIQYNAAAAALLFMVVMAFMRAGVMLEERSLGTLGRMMSAPVSKGEIIAGQILGSTFLSLAQFALLAVGTRLILGVFWGPWLSAALLGTAFALAAAGIGTAAAAVLRDRKSADQASGIVGNLFGLLSGSLIPIYALPSAVRTIGRLTPNYWAMQGFLDQMAGVGQGRLLLPIVVLVAIAAASGVFGVWRLASK